MEMKYVCVASCPRLDPDDMHCRCTEPVDCPCGFTPEWEEIENDD